MSERQDLRDNAHDVGGGAKRGVFWVVEGKLLVCPFREGEHPNAVAKSGRTYNHERLWAEADVSNRPFDYYPRGRVEVSGDGSATVYASPHVDLERFLPAIKALYGIADGKCRVHVDHSAHYRCHLDEGWETQRKAERGGKRKKRRR